jgi:hypothetical protein
MIQTKRPHWHNEFHAPLRNQTAQGSPRRRSNFRCAAIRLAVVWRAERCQQRNRLREASQFLPRIREYTVHAQLRVKSKV